MCGPHESWAPTHARGPWEASEPAHCPGQPAVRFSWDDKCVHWPLQVWVSPLLTSVWLWVNLNLSVPQFSHLQVGTQGS